MTAASIAIVAIGRNEGERLKACLRSLPADAHRIYVDSGSTDGSVAFAEGQGVTVVTLPPATRFTAALARNAGLAEAGTSGEAHHFADRVFTLMLIVQLVLLNLALPAMPWVVHALAPGFAEDGERFQLAVALTRITFPYLLFMTLVTLLSGILNAHRHFAVAAGAPVLLNLAMLAALSLSFLFPNAAYAAAWGVAVSVPQGFDRSQVRNRLVSPRCPRVFERHSGWRTIAEWRGLGVMTQGASWPADHVMATLLEPDGPGATAYLLTSNYRVILDYNCSNFYALSVGLLADAVER